MLEYYLIAIFTVACISNVIKFTIAISQFEEESIQNIWVNTCLCISAFSISFELGMLCTVVCIAQLIIEFLFFRVR